ncbi:TetR family transcriptional regulator [Agromyces sp. Root81]|uniref:TetR/AcrR family transcriptional regulator n=1 Tax=Agromyces sp. Root81 TaxID=1736601 RepID=UPI0006FD7DBC|nr:TetR/AcrR family transcriptional regulator [Agromyces sp. Root81]KRC59241.1 TetR family transcriptional regulator [Agromyces sp. Root81]
MDVRVERTRRSLQDALLDLARERPLDEVTVAEIAARAGVNRSSFYQHYSEKETLLADALDAAAEAAAATLPGHYEPPSGPPQALVQFLQHIDEHAELYRSVFGGTGSTAVLARLRARIEAIVREGLVSSPTPAYEGVPLDVIAAGITGSALGVVEAWLMRDPRPSVEVGAEWVWRALLGPGGSWA